ncbi:MAG: glycoside hydrolase family 27 protein [Bacteroidota bacterium]|nr:glycoside hydrolase family 27 protein [Bacteroidota bacterium]
MKKVTLSLLSLMIVLSFRANVVSALPGPENKKVKTGNTAPDVPLPAPPMGWNSWNHFQRDINEQLIMDEADAMVASGMKDAGYEYINLDDCWMSLERDKDGNLQSDPIRFPHGIKYLSDYVHKKGLKLGVYSSAGTKTCAGWPASLDHEEADAKMFAKWGVDYLKYDNCNNEGRPAIARYTKMKNALDASGRPIVFSICEWGSNNPWEWAPTLGGLWRTTGDISDNWNSMIHILDEQVGLNTFASKGHWNDPDMLEVGNGGMTNTEYVTHFSLWSILAAPLITGNDLRHMSDDTHDILTNKEVIAIDQDPAAKEGYKLTDEGDKEVWVKPLADGSWSVLLLNRSDDRSFMTMKIQDLDIKKSGTYTVRNLWSHRDEQRTDGLVRADVAPHGVQMFKVTAQN